MEDPGLFPIEAASLAVQLYQVIVQMDLLKFYLMARVVLFIKQ